MSKGALRGLLILGVLSACKPAPVAVDAGAGVVAAPIVAAHPPEVPAAPDAVAHRVAITGMKFVPARLVVKPGERIRWTNEDLVPHTVTASNHLFDSSIVAPNATWEWTAGKAGDFSYACLIHPEMTGTVAVSDAR